ncbi:ABC transporter substrate-binding protein [Mycolicibacterium fallax]|uniref:Solute-binding protein family 5 domain-containing protein n=1 Tax=Mycolicibacterium fallax TaxID=1793 RepID=A0A1X1RH27_MYCFA|nr:ABC transporter substrate-binding protein [Mycolicibacterium fallax]ORV06169.1 hypothetical protein AWC04_05725 [Mycolicibacterium fallax]BBY97067.1 hypothetical protein MFAL_05340 [Mycolicibacterium fallax]
MTARATVRRLAAATLAVALAGATVSGCSSTADDVDYAVGGVLDTYNTNTVDGAASAGPQAFARVLTGFSYHGPDGQVVADHDFGTVSVAGRAPLVLDYQISDNAVYSDGIPVTCDDMLLTWAAQSGRFPQFGAASRAGYTDIAGLECQAGAKKARVTFINDRNFVDHLQLFGATSMMPAHVLSDRLGYGVTEAIQAVDPVRIAEIAEAWNTTWALSPGVDTAGFPSSGPYRIDSVRDDGAVLLVANERWWGSKPITARVTVWPRSIEIQDRLDDRAVDVVDVPAGSSGTLSVPDDFDRVEKPSAGIQQLFFAPVGVASVIPARRAIALCTPREEIARNAGVPLSNARLNPAADDAFSPVENVPESGGPFVNGDPAAARASLGGKPLNVRIGYRAPNARLAAVVGAIARACQPAGILVEDAAGPDVGPSSLQSGAIDVLVAGTGGASGSGSTGSSAMDAYQFHSANGNNLPRYINPAVDGIVSALAVTTDPKEQTRLLRDGDVALWEDMPTLPLYRQQRLLLTSKKMHAVTSNVTKWGAGWNMDRWQRSK